MQVDTVRVYDLDTTDRGYRVLVDRLWPRGVSKHQVRIDEWAKDLAPSTDLRKWFDHDNRKWAAFKAKYRNELEEKADRLEELRKKARRRKVLLLYAAKDTEHNQAVVLKEVLEDGQSD